MELRETPVARTGTLIRRPAHKVYEAFVDPAVTANFWFTHGTDRLDAGKPVTWTWEMYAFSTRVEVKELVPDRKILIEWDAGTDEATTVEWTFTERAADRTVVNVRNFDLKGDADAQVSRAIDSTDGFAQVLAGAKAWLEYGLRLDLIADRHPDMLVPSWRDGSTSHA